MCVRAVPFDKVEAKRERERVKEIKIKKNDILYFDLDVEPYKTTEKIGGFVCQ